MSSAQTKKTPITSLLIGLTWIALLLIPALVYLLTQQENFQFEWVKKINFDLTNSLLTYFTVLLLLLTVLYQRKDLKFQAEELSLTRNELMKSAQAQEDLAKVQSKAALTQEIISKANLFAVQMQAIGTQIESRFTRIASLKAEIQELRETEDPSSELKKKWSIIRSYSKQIEEFEIKLDALKKQTETFLNSQN